MHYINREGLFQLSETFHNHTPLPFQNQDDLLYQRDRPLNQPNYLHPSVNRKITRTRLHVIAEHFYVPIYTIIGIPRCNRARTIKLEQKLHQTRDVCAVTTY